MSGQASRRVPSPDAARWTAGSAGSPGTPLALKTRRDDDGTVLITAAGEIDLTSQPLLRDALFAALAEDNAHTVLLDMATVTFLDATGIATLVHAHNTATATDRTVRLRNPRPIVTLILEITGLAQTFGLDQT